MTKLQTEPQFDQSDSADRSAGSSQSRAPANRTPATGRGRSRKTIINFWLDAALLVVFVSLGIVAVIVQFVFPPGTAASGWTLWGLSYGQWASLQFVILCVLALGVLVHVMLHWSWICGVIARRLLGRSKLPDSGTQTLYGVGLLIVLLNLAGVIVALAILGIESPVE